MNELVARLRKQAVCIHIAATKECAEDVSDGLRKAADLIGQQEKKIAELERECRQQSAGVLVLASQRANYLERAEKAEAERDELARTIDLLNVERSKAEAALRGCMAHADAMEAEIFNLSAYDSNDAVIAYRQWRAKR